MELPGGGTLSIRGLSRAETIQVRTLSPDVAAIEKLSIRYATDSTESEIDAWYATARNDDVEMLVDAIATLSGLNDTVGKVDAEVSHSANGTG